MCTFVMVVGLAFFGWLVSSFTQQLREVSQSTRKCVHWAALGVARIGPNPLLIDVVVAFRLGGHATGSRLLAHQSGDERRPFYCTVRHFFPRSPPLPPPAQPLAPGGMMDTLLCLAA